jgi:succinate dehydrogenase / fumarate reductase membrane anchor subunit
MTDKSTNPVIMRSMLGRARGMGASKTGTATWWAERVTSIALIPLTLWFVWAAMHLAGQPRVNVVHWVAQPVVTTLLIALVATTFHHIQMGLQAVIDDYVHSEAAKLASLLVMKGAVILLAIVSIVSILKMAFAG